MAADLDLTVAANRPWYVYDLATGATKTVLVPRNTDVTIAHTGLTNAGATSGATDAVVVCNGNQTLTADLSAGAKGIIWANGDSKVSSLQIRSAAAGDNIIQIAAVTSGARVQFIMGHPK